ncbi:hypothetical protein INT44_005297 [Umbelopsis vinacea]|uniref:Uncharacterized protein n=1 Tax=Umbelopsis vinacea TaxID=44442 RepID=A0A8H7Q846_9FUNG|nr:hypothetical protein INT44_005297 [Umbelopsis vinacea]
MQNTTASQPQKKRRGRPPKRLIREDEDGDDYSVASENDVDNSVLMSTSKVSKKKKWMPLTGDARKHIQILLNAALLYVYRSTLLQVRLTHPLTFYPQLRASTQNAPNSKSNPQVQHVLNEVVRRIDRKLLRTLVPVSAKEKTFDREQLSSQNAALQVAVMSEVEENTMLQQQIEDELRELEKEEHELRSLRERNRTARVEGSRQQSTSTSQPNRIHDYAQALMMINQVPKSNMHLATESEDDYFSEEDGPLERIKLSLGGQLQQTYDRTSHFDSVAADIMETSHKMQTYMSSRRQHPPRANSFEQDDDFQ